jgi:Fe2+ transport system protein FeoA
LNLNCKPTFQRETQGRRAAMPETLVPLEYLQNGEWGEVAEVAGEPHWVSRAAELGLRPGSRLRMLQPGSPCLFQLGECRLSLRGDESVAVFVRPVGEVD